MIIEAVKKILAPLNIEIFDSDATGAKTNGYILVLGATPSRGEEESLTTESGQSGIIVRAVGVDARHARTVLLKTRELLFGKMVQLPQAWVSFQFDGCPRPAQIDRILPETTTNTNRVFIDDEYTVYIQERKK